MDYIGGIIVDFIRLQDLMQAYEFDVSIIITNVCLYAV